MSQQLQDRKRVGKGTHESADLSDERERSRNTALWTGTDQDVCSNDCASIAERISTCGEQLEKVDPPEGLVWQERNLQVSEGTNSIDNENHHIELDGDAH